MGAGTARSTALSATEAQPRPALPRLPALPILLEELGSSPGGLTTSPVCRRAFVKTLIHTAATALAGRAQIGLFVEQIPFQVSGRTGKTAVGLL